MRRANLCVFLTLLVTLGSGSQGSCQETAQPAIVVGGKSLPLIEDPDYLYVWRSASDIDGHGARIKAAHTMALAAVIEQSKAVGLDGDIEWAKPAGKDSVAIGTTATTTGKIIGTVVRRKPDVNVQKIGKTLDELQKGTRVAPVFRTPGFPKPFYVDRWIVIRPKGDELTREQQDLLRERYRVVPQIGRRQSGSWYLELGENSPSPRVVVPELRNLDFIASAEFTFGYISDDNCATTETRGVPHLADEWHLPQLRVPRAWDLIKNSGRTPAKIRVAILDTGVDLKHPALIKRLVKGNDFLGGNGNGGLVGNDPHYHGTACAGIIAAEAAGSSDLTGIATPVAPNLIPVRIADDRGVITDFPVIQALDWILDLNVSQRPQILSCSFGETLGTPELASRFAELEQQGILALAATGNFGNDLPVSFPAAYPNVFAVGAVNQANGIQPYSQGGDESAGTVAGVAPSGGDTCGDATAPGIWTTDISGPLGRNHQAGEAGNYFGLFTGTSAATPMGAGIATLVWSMRPELKANEIRCILERTAQKVPNPNDYPNGGKGRRPLYGYGLLCADRAVSLALQKKSDGSFVVAAGLGCQETPVAAAPIPDSFTIELAGKEYPVRRNPNVTTLRVKSESKIDWSRILKPGVEPPQEPVWAHQGIHYYSIPTNELANDPPPQLNPELMALEPAWDLSQVGGIKAGWLTGDLICHADAADSRDELVKLAEDLGLKLVYDKRGTVVLRTKDPVQAMTPVLLPALDKIGKLSGVKACYPDFSRRNTGQPP